MSSGSILHRYGFQGISILILLLFIFIPRILTGEIYFDQAQELELKGSFSEASVSYEDSANRLWWENGLYEKAASQAKKAGALESAITLFATAENKDGLSNAGWIELGDSFLEKGDVNAAIDAWQSVGGRTQDSAEAIARLARAYRQLGEINKAMRFWQEVLKIDPNNDEAYFTLGLLLMTRQPGKALPELMQATSLNKLWDTRVQVLREGLNLALLQNDIPYQLVVSGRSLASIGEWVLAQEAFFQAIQFANDYAEAWAWLGEAYQHMGKDGFPSLQKALTLDPNSATIQALIGLNYRRQGQLDLAWSAYSRAAALEPANPAWQLALGDLSVQNGELIIALSHFNQAIVLAPQDPEVWRGMALFCVQNDVDISLQGMQAALQLLKLAPEDWQSYNVMGQVLMAMGDLESAQLYFVRASQLSPNQSEIYLHLGYLLLMQNQRDGAYEYLLYSRQLDPQGGIGGQAQRLIDQYFP
jgi:tetratricopeptide (TPR) repeat protein